eukprot:583830-Alexandrium_andersonii.AAC.1
MACAAPGQAGGTGPAPRVRFWWAVRWPSAPARATALPSGARLSATCSAGSTASTWCAGLRGTGPALRARCVRATLAWAASG